MWQAGYSPKGKEKENPLMEEDDTESNVENETQDFGATGLSPDQNVTGLKGNFEQQQVMIGQLREMLKQKDSSKCQEKEIEDYATRLAKMKPRLIRGRGRGRSKDREESSKKQKIQTFSAIEEQDQLAAQSPLVDSSAEFEDSAIDVPGAAPASSTKDPDIKETEEGESLHHIPSKTPASHNESGIRSKVLHLRKQLDEHRIKFERQQRESADKRAAMEDMKERIEKLRLEVEHRDNVIQSLQVDSLHYADPNLQHLYQQIMHKDNTVLELADRVQQLEGIIHDQQEHLNEKDQIIMARTEAVSLISKDKDEKLMKTIQELEEMKIAMKDMQASFVNREEQWKETENGLNNLVAEKNKKISVLEENCHRVESIRFELSTRNAELQEKIISLQCNSNELRNEFANAEASVKHKSLEVEELKKKLIRAEAFGQRKLKNLEKQLKCASGDEDLGSKTLELQNQIAELEEEKGNLQLKLVDFDELKSQTDKLSDTVSNCGHKIEQLNTEIFSQISTVASLENEKIKLVQELNTKDLKINTLEEASFRYKSQFEDMKQSKVTLELRLCEIEEERDLAQKKQKDLENEQIKETTTATLSIDDIHFRNIELEDINIKYKSQLEERDMKISFIETLITEKENAIKDLEEQKEEKVNENQCLVSFLAEKESLLTSQSIQLEKHDLVVESIQEEMSSKDNDIKNLVSQSNSLQLEVESITKQLEESELTVNELTSRIAHFKHELKSNEKRISLLQASESSLKSVLNEKENTLRLFEEEIDLLKEELNKKESVISDHISRIDYLDSMLQSRQKQILNLESEIADKIRDNSKQEVKCNKYEEELEKLKENYEKTEAKLKAECDAIACLFADKENEVALLEQHINSKAVELKNSEAMSSKFESEACEMNRLYDCLREEKETLAKELTQLKEKLKEYESNFDSSELDINMLQQSLQEKEDQIQRLTSKMTTSDFLRFQSPEEDKPSVELLNQRLVEEEWQTLLAEKETHCQQLQIEFQSILNTKEEMNSQMQLALTEKDSEIYNLRESLTNLSGATPDSLENSEKIQLEINEKCQEITLLKNEVANAKHEIDQLYLEAQTTHHRLSCVAMELNTSKQEAEYYRKQTEELDLRIEQLKNQVPPEGLSQTQTVKNHAEMHAEIQSLVAEIENKNTIIIQLQKELEASSARCLANENLQATVNHFEQKLSDQTNEFDHFKQLYQSSIEENNQSLFDFQEESRVAKCELEAKQEEIVNLKMLCKDFEMKVGHLEEELAHSEHLKLDAQSETTELKNGIARVEAEKTVFEEKIAHLELACTEKEAMYNNSLVQNEELSKQLLMIDEEICSLRLKTASSVSEVFDEAHTSTDEANAIAEENNFLKKRLEEAQQAITCLETSLATQSMTEENTQASVGEWGIVDLGEPSVKEPTLSMHTSLVEKDKTLTVIQEQLKNALESVNTANDEKKILQYQMNTLEAELSHKDQKVYHLEATISELESKVRDLRTQNIPATIAELGDQQPFQSSTNPDLENPSWFTPAVDQSSTLEHIDRREVSETGESSLSADPPIRQELSGETDVQRETGPYSEAPTEEQLVQELQYKLAWYEENWPLWTEHYNQIQTSYQSAEEQIALLNKEIETLKSTDSSDTHSHVAENLMEKVKEFKEIIAALEEEKAHLEEKIQTIKSEDSAAVDNITSQFQSQLEDSNREIFRLRSYEHSVIELQNQLQTLQHQCSVLETKAANAESDAAKIIEYETLYGELQTCMQESETKQEGSKSRVQELELMVQSAESEIARLRSDFQRLTIAGDALEKERSALQSAVENLKEEQRKCVGERERLEMENDRLQREAASLHSQSIEFQGLNQRYLSEINQLKSEVEILEGDSERNRNNYEILDADSMRLRNENEILTQNNQIVLAEKESLETETGRLVNSNSSLAFENDHIRGEMQRLSEVATSAESEISRLKLELHTKNTLNSQYTELEGKYTDLQEKLGTLEEKLRTECVAEAQDLHLEEVDWVTEARIEDEHIQRSSSVERTLQGELDQLKEKVIALEKEKNEIGEELQASKLKNGKIIHKLKAANNKNENLTKEIQKLKKKAGGFSDLDLALEEEWKSQVLKVENERDELKIKLDELEKEKSHMKDQLDVMESAQDKYLELKESQDATVRQLSSRNKNLESQVASLEWKISELEENFEHQKSEIQSAFREGETNLSRDPKRDSSAIDDMAIKIASLEKEIEELQVENSSIVKLNEELQFKLDELASENESFKSVLEDLRDAKSKAETNSNTYKTSFLELHTEHETLQENYNKLDKTMETQKYELNTLKAAYDVLFEEYHQLQDNRDSVRLELGIVTGERGKLQEEVNSLNNQLQALQEEEEEEIIRALQDECSDLREQNNELKDEITRLNEAIRQMEETVERTKHSLDQQVDIQDLLRMEIVSKSEQNDIYSTTVNSQDQQIKYMKAEIASLKSKSSQQQLALENLEPEIAQLKETLSTAEEKNKQLVQQVEAADGSLMMLATRNTMQQKTERFSSLEATELEAALTSLHLRDLRCQQLSLEINKLLEERDGLQLKLSASLRQIQDLTRELSLSQQQPSSQMQLSPSSLSQKLAELRDLNSSLELKTLGSSKVSSGSSTLPPSLPTFVSHTAPATPTATRHLDYIVTRENQGASSTIMNWILGKSTPKEVLHV